MVYSNINTLTKQPDNAEIRAQTNYCTDSNCLLFTSGRYSTATYVHVTVYVKKSQYVRNIHVRRERK